MTEASLRNASLFAQLDETELGELRRYMTRHTFRRGDVVFHQGDPSGRLFVVEEGWVKLTRQSDGGDELLIDVFGPGSLFGEVSIFSNEPRTGTVAAIEPVTMTALSRDSFYKLVLTHPRIALGCLEILAGRLRASDELVQDMSFLDVPARLAKRLLELADQRGVDTAGGRMIDLRITQEELATMVGTTRESINKTLAVFRRQGILGNASGRMVIKDRDRLGKRVY
ncbi:MAG TPA: Crp/Fnr family transcriptional regulator [Chloroflexota bacterium]|nr:Crp/Fnr family transcriptional regulator [Chloroflexota bacterium]